MAMHLNICIYVHSYAHAHAVAIRVHPQFIAGSHKGRLQDNQDIMSQ